MMRSPLAAPPRRILAPLGPLAALALAIGLTACGGGGGGSTSSTATGETSPRQGAGTTSAKEAEPGGGSGSSGTGSTEPEPPASAFHPKPHHDSGGGSQQFIVKGGDNSVQEFGAEASEAELQAAATALHGFLDARAARNWAAACGYLAKSVTESFEQLAAQARGGEGGGCAAFLEKLTNPAAKGELRAEAAKADVGSLRTEGDRSFVIYTGIGGTVLAMPMTTEGGAWRVASLSGVPLN